MSIERNIKIFSGKVTNSLGKKAIEQEYYEWCKAVPKNTVVYIENVMVSTDDGFLYMVIHYTITTIPENPDVLKPEGPLNERFSSFGKPDKSVIPPEPDVGKGEY